MKRQGLITAALWTGTGLVTASAPAQAHEGETQRVLRASARLTPDGRVALDVLAALSLARTPSMLAIAQLDLNHDGRFDTLETALAEAALGDRPDHGLVVTLDGVVVRPKERSVAVQLDAQGNHVSVAVLATFTAPAPARFAVSPPEGGAGPPLVVSPAPEVHLDGAASPRTCAPGAGPCLFTVTRAAP
jgi:hypothetical protein